MLLVIAGVAAVQRPTDLEVSRLRVVDANGKTRASIELGTDGEPSLTFRSADGKERLAMSVFKGGRVGLVLSDANEAPGIALHTSEQGAATIEIMNRKRSKQISLFVCENGLAFVKVGTMGQNHSAVSLGNTAEGRPLLALVGDNVATRATLQPGLQGGLDFSLLSADATRLSLSLDRDGTPALQLNGKAGQRSVLLRGPEAGPDLSFLDAAGTVRLLNGLDGEGSPYMSLADEKTSGMILGIKFNNPFFTVADREARPRIDCSFADNIMSAFQLRDERGVPKVDAGVQPNGDGYLRIISGKTVLNLPEAKK
jgi:hypothetical protein